MTKRLAINPAGLRPCCVETALNYADQYRLRHELGQEVSGVPAEGLLAVCFQCNRQLIVKEGAWRAFPAGVTS